MTNSPKAGLTDSPFGEHVQEKEIQVKARLQRMNVNSADGSCSKEDVWEGVTCRLADLDPDPH